MLEEEGQLEKFANSAKNAGLPGYFYTSHEIYEQEKEMLFMRDGLAAGRVSTKTRC